MVVSGYAAFHSPQVLVTTLSISRAKSSSCSGPETATPRNVSNTEKVCRSNITLFDRESRPEVRSSMVSKPGGGRSVK